MTYQIRAATERDTPFLWKMLYYAAHMDEDNASIESAKTDPNLLDYVSDWGARPGDLGSIAITAEGVAVGAAWIRRMPPANPLYEIVEPGCPELAIAIEPSHLGEGLGTRLLRHLLEAASHTHRAVVLSVRVDNPAKRLYDRCGFETVARIRNRVGTESYVMRIGW